VVIYFAEGKVWLFSSNSIIQHKIKFLIRQGKLSVPISSGEQKKPQILQAQCVLLGVLSDINLSVSLCCVQWNI